MDTVRIRLRERENQEKVTPIWEGAVTGSHIPHTFTIELPPNEKRPNALETTRIELEIVTV